MVSDEVLVTQTLSGDLSGFEELVNRYKRKVFALVYRMVGQQQEAEDICQEIFITVYEKLYQFDINKNFSPWIYRIATNASISALRRKKKVVTLNFDESFSSTYEINNSSQFGDPQFMFERRELADQINKAILQLPDNYRAVITLRYKMDLDNQEIAEILDISKENVEVRVHRARKALRKILLQKGLEGGITNELSANR